VSAPQGQAVRESRRLVGRNARFPAVSAVGVTQLEEMDRGLTRSCSPNVTFDSSLSGLVLAVAFDEGERDLGDVFPAAVEYQ
jgi:hypothetical protein